MRGQVGIALVLGGWLLAAEPAPAPVPPEVLAAAAAASRPQPLAPTPEVVAIADQVDVLLVRAEGLLAVQDPVAAGERFVAAVNLIEPLTKADRRALGARYRAQRQHMSQLATRLLQDPAVSAALAADTATPPTVEVPAAPVPAVPAPAKP